MQRKDIFGIMLFFALLSGCVSSGTYQQKKLQAEGLEQSLQERQAAYAKLTAENEQLKGEVKRLTGELAALGSERDALAGAKKGLEESLQSTSDAKNQKIGELSQRVGQLEAENARLKEDVAQLQKLKEIEVQKTSKTYENLLDSMKSEISKGEVTMSELKGKLTVNLVESVLFDSGKAEVKPNGLVVLQKVIDILKNIKDKAIRIEGHTDNVPIVGALTRTLRIVGLPTSRVGAKELPGYMAELTPAAEFERARQAGIEQRLAQQRGAGRPTKQERRDLAKLFGD